MRPAQRQLPLGGILHSACAGVLTSPFSSTPESTRQQLLLHPRRRDSIAAAGVLRLESRVFSTV